MENNEINYLLKKEKDIRSKIKELENKFPQNNRDKLILEEMKQYLANIQERKDRAY